MLTILLIICVKSQSVASSRKSSLLNELEGPHPKIQPRRKESAGLRKSSTDSQGDPFHVVLKHREVKEQACSIMECISDVIVLYLEGV